MKRKQLFLLAIAIMLTLVSCGSKAGQETDSQEVGRETGEETGLNADQDIEGETDQSTGRENSLGQENDNAGNPESSEEDAGAQQAGTSEETTELRDDYKDNFDVDEKAAAEFGRMIKEAVAQKDVEMLADLTGFPVYVGLSGGTVVETRADFIALDVEELLSDEMVSSIAEADENNLSPSMAGFTLYGSDGDPSITFGVREGRLAISGINYGY